MYFDSHARGSHAGSPDLAHLLSMIRQLPMLIHDTADATAAITLRTAGDADGVERRRAERDLRMPAGLIMVLLAWLAIAMNRLRWASVPLPRKHRCRCNVCHSIAGMPRTYQRDAQKYRTGKPAITFERWPSMKQINHSYQTTQCGSHESKRDFEQLGCCCCCSDLTLAW